MQWLSTCQLVTCTVFKGQGSKIFWFWFDEQNCSLKYYKSRDTYISKVYEPLGYVALCLHSANFICVCVCRSIDLRYAKVTPGITSGFTSKQFQIRFDINTDYGVYNNTFVCVCVCVCGPVLIVGPV